MKNKNLIWLTIVTAIFSIGLYIQKRNGVSNIFAQERIQSCSYDIVKTYPHDPQAFTQGLIYDQGQLYESTGLNGKSSLRRVELETGEVKQIHDLEERYFAEGMTLWKDRLIQLTWVSKIGFVYDQKTFNQLSTFTYPTQGWGLTHDGQELIMSDGSDTLYFLNPDTFEETNRLQVSDRQNPVNRLNELEYVKGEIFANIWMSDRIARISPQTGKVLGWIDLREIIEPKPLPKRDAVLNGIAYDAKEDRLFVTGKLWPQLFEIDLLCE